MTTTTSHPPRAHTTTSVMAAVVGLAHRDASAAEVEIRALGQGDRETLRAFYASLSDESRYRRFFQGLHDVPDGVLRHLADADGCDHVVLVAVIGDSVVGEAQYVRLHAEPGAAEVSVAVSDDHQGHGIGRQLLGALGIVARGAGIDTFTYTVLPMNRPALALFRSFGGRHGWDEGMVAGRAPLASWSDAGVDPASVPAATCDIARTVAVAA